MPIDDSHLLSEEEIAELEAEAEKIRAAQVDPVRRRYTEGGKLGGAREPHPDALDAVRAFREQYVFVEALEEDLQHARLEMYERAAKAVAIAPFHMVTDSIGMKHRSGIYYMIDQLPKLKAKLRARALSMEQLLKGD